MAFFSHNVICCCSCFYLWSISLSGSISPSQSRTGWRAAQHGVKWCLTTVSFARWTPALQTWAPSQAAWPRLPKAAVVGLWWLFCGTCSRWQTITQLTRCLTVRQVDTFQGQFSDCFIGTNLTLFQIIAHFTPSITSPWVVWFPAEGRKTLLALVCLSSWRRPITASLVERLETSCSNK